MEPLLKPSSHSNLYRATMRSPPFGLPSRNQITRLDLRERVGIYVGLSLQCSGYGRHTRLGSPLGGLISGGRRSL